MAQELLCNHLGNISNLEMSERLGIYNFKRSLIIRNSIIMHHQSFQRHISTAKLIYCLFLSRNRQTCCKVCLNLLLFISKALILLLALWNPVRRKKSPRISLLLSIKIIPVGIIISTIF